MWCQIMMNLKTVNLKEIYRTKEKKRTENNKQKLQAKKRKAGNSTVEF